MGRETFEVDNPSLTNREWVGSSPRRYVVSSQPLLLPDGFQLIQSTSVDNIFQQLYKDGIQTLLVEGGAELLQSFIDSGMWDESYVEKGVENIYGMVKAPVLKTAYLADEDTCFGHKVMHYLRQ